MADLPKMWAKMSKALKQKWWAAHGGGKPFPAEEGGRSAAKAKKLPTGKKTSELSRGEKTAAGFRMSAIRRENQRRMLAAMKRGTAGGQQPSSSSGSSLSSAGDFKRAIKSGDTIKTGLGGHSDLDKLLPEPEKKKMKKEEVKELDEISQRLAVKAVSKRGADVYGDAIQRGDEGDPHQEKKFTSGLKRVKKKFGDAAAEKVNRKVGDKIGYYEEVEQIDETSSDTAKSYLDKVRFKQAKRAVIANMGAPGERKLAAAAIDGTAKSMELARKRVKEEVEQTNESKIAGTLAAMEQGRYKPEVGHKIRTRYGGQNKGTVTKVDGGHVYFKHENGKTYRTTENNVVKEAKDLSKELADNIRKEGGGKHTLVRNKAGTLVLRRVKKMKEDVEQVDEGNGSVPPPEHMPSDENPRVFRQLVRVRKYNPPPKHNPKGTAPGDGRPAAYWRSKMKKEEAEQMDEAADLDKLDYQKGHKLMYKDGKQKIVRTKASQLAHREQGWKERHSVRSAIKAGLKKEEVESVEEAKVETLTSWRTKTPEVIYKNNKKIYDRMRSTNPEKAERFRLKYLVDKKKAEVTEEVEQVDEGERMTAQRKAVRQIAAFHKANSRVSVHRNKLKKDVNKIVGEIGTGATERMARAIRDARKKVKKGSPIYSVTEEVEQMNERNTESHPNLWQTHELRHSSGKALKKGDVVKSWRGDKHKILGFEVPLHSGSSGRVFTNQGSFFPSVVGAKVVKKKAVKEEVEYIEEKLTAADPASKWIKDFVHSDNPKFAGKSKKERMDMALGAYYAKKRANEEVVQEKLDPVGSETTDINNDKKVDKTDVYLHARRQKIGAAIAKKKGM